MIISGVITFLGVTDGISEVLDQGFTGPGPSGKYNIIYE